MILSRQNQQLSNFGRSIAILGGAMLIVAGLLWFTTPAVQAAECDVPSGSYGNIQAAVDDNSCDGIQVAAGTYVGAVTITRTVIITGAGPTSTILDGSDTDRPLTLSNAGVEVWISDLSVTNGDARSSDPTVGIGGRIGGGILVASGARLWLDNVHVYDNVAKSSVTIAGFGGGIGVWDSAELHAQNIRVYNNVANNNSGSGFGGGIAILSATTYITNSQILTNAAKVDNNGNSAYGGGLYIAADFSLSSPRFPLLSIVNSTVGGNYATSSETPGYGGGLYIGEADLTRIQSQNTVWRDNKARLLGSGDDEGYGGAIAGKTGSTNQIELSILDDTFYRNIANEADGISPGSDAAGGAISLNALAPNLIRAVISQTTFYSNTAQFSIIGTNIGGNGGAIYARRGDITIYGTAFYSNTARPIGSTDRGGAIRLSSSSLTMTHSILRNNTATLGAALYTTNGASELGRLYLENNWIVNNNGPSTVYYDNDNVSINDLYRHLTVVGNSTGRGLDLVDGQLAITNTIVTTFGVGISNTAASFVGDSVLFFGNGTDQLGALPTNVINADPRFVDPDNFDYHIQATSPARDAGVDIGVTDDIDYEPRDAQPDLGADEYNDSPIVGLTAQNSGPTLVNTATYMTATVSSGNNISYTWDLNNGPFVGSGNPISYTYSMTGTYMVVVTATNDSGVVTATTSVEVFDNPSDTPVTGLTAQSSSPTLVNTTTYLTATVSSGDNINYTWNYGDGTTGSGNPISHSYSMTGTYTAIVTATNGSGVETATTSVLVFDASSDTPITGLTAQNSSPALVNDSVNLTATVSSGENISYTWSYGDGTSGSGLSTTHQYTQAGIYVATVTAVNETSSQTATTTVYIGDVIVEVGPNLTNTYSPKDVTIAEGESVLWVLRSGNHSVTANDASFEQPLGTDWSPYLRKFDTPGTVGYYCVLHGAAGGFGMAGSVEVVGSEPGPEETPKIFLPLLEKQG